MTPEHEIRVISHPQKGGIAKYISIFASGFGLGYLPFSGTIGSLWGILLSFLIGILRLSVFSQIILALLFIVIAIPVCDVVEKYFGKKDDRRIVADEFMTFPVVLIAIPWLERPWFLGVAFVVARILDVIKPPPARQSQKLKGGLGVVMDDVISNVYSLIILHLIWKFLN